MSDGDQSSGMLLDCIATDPGSTTLYGIGSARQNEKKIILLVKSNPNPDHLSLRKWDVVSTSWTQPFSYWQPPFGTVDCTVSSRGVFTAFFRNKDHINPRQTNIPVGVHYDPETQKWTSIRTSTYYAWTSDRSEHMSFYISNNGVERLVHMMTDDEGSVIRFGVLNEASMYLQMASIWQKSDVLGGYKSVDQFDTMPNNWGKRLSLTPKSGFFRKSRYQRQMTMFYADGHLYMMYYNQPSNITIYSYLFTDPTAPPPPNPMVFNGPGNFFPHYFFAGRQGNTSYLGGIGADYGLTMVENYQTFIMQLVDGIPQSPEISTSPFHNSSTSNDGEAWEMEPMAIHDNFVAFGGQLPGQSPLVVGLTSVGIYEFSTAGKNATSPIGMMEVIVDGDFVVRPARNTTMENYYYSDKNQAREFSKAATLAIIFGITLALFSCIMFSDRRKLLKKRAVEEEKQRLRDIQLEQLQQQQHRQQQEQYVEMGVRRANNTTRTTTRATIRQHNFSNDDDDDDENDHLRGGRDRRPRVL
ncbi:hypothetical protein BGZ96_009722 [Linnemannia gamsii]|uniref:Kelch repeat protein n=1 Tax=Linnemannia gamsii TaxID=64522 RepID=A0ABQ7KEW6_9FUNG|nr:hypothetical protein BGZ96_009722 [Linnemannia gamsii]